MAPQFYIADRPLPVGTEMGGEAAPVKAFDTGDRVPPDFVDRFGWADYVHDPSAPAPAQSSAPTTSSGKASSRAAQASDKAPPDRAGSEE